jgi:putative transposase
MSSALFKGGFSISDQNETHFLTFSVCGWIDLFTRKVYKDILIDALVYAQENKGLILNGFVIMSNHLHLLASTSEGHRLSDFIRDYKKFTHSEMIKVIESDVESRRLWMLHQFRYYAGRTSRNEVYQIWTNDNHPEQCFTPEFTFCKLDYIHDNPVKEGIVQKPEDYIYSSASNYVCNKGIIHVEIL